MSHDRRLAAKLGRILVGLGLTETAVAATVAAPPREETLAVQTPEELPAGEVRVFLPPGGVRADTPLLVALDGQNMTAWKLAATLERLAAAGEITPPLVVAISATADRIEEYGLARTLDYAGRGKKAAAFQRRVLDFIVPEVRQRYGLRADPARTAIMGASLGGLSAFDLAWAHPDVFGTVGVFSGSLWWRGEDGDWRVAQRSRLAHRIVRETAAKPALRLWFEAGTADETDDRDGNGVIDAIQDTTELIDELTAKEFRRDVDVAYHEIAGGHHHESTWAEALPVFLKWAFPRR
ncbi:MAG: esterase family protein [Opitutae bacterium]|nr:esterase family protein [Opitutae bacterium]